MKSDRSKHRKSTATAVAKGSVIDVRDARATAAASSTEHAHATGAPRVAAKTDPVLASQPDGLTSGPPNVGAQTSNNPFDPARYRLSANYQANLGVKKVITNVPCRKPNRHEFVRVRPGEAWCLETMVFEDKVHRESYLVDPDVTAELSNEIVPVCLYLAVNRQHDPFLWQVKLPGPDGRSNQWNDSAVQAALLAQSKWVRVAANMMVGYYDVAEATGQLSEPQWPEVTFDRLLEICFRDHIIRDMNHIAVKRLRGEI